MSGHLLDLYLNISIYKILSLHIYKLTKTVSGVKASDNRTCLVKYKYLKRS